MLFISQFESHLEEQEELEQKMIQTQNRIRQKQLQKDHFDNELFQQTSSIFSNMIQEDQKEDVGLS